MIQRISWDDLYPRAKPDDEPHPGIVKGTHPHECWYCGRPTQWDSLYWEAPICGYICDDLAWLGYGNEVWSVGWGDDVPTNYARIIGVEDRPVPDPDEVPDVGNDAEFWLGGRVGPVLGDAF